MQGFIIFDNFGHLYACQGNGRLVQSGKIKYREEIIDGLENAPEAFVGPLKGENFGKRVIHVGQNGRII